RDDLVTGVQTCALPIWRQRKPQSCAIEFIISRMRPGPTRVDCSGSLAVGNPNIFHLGGVFQEPAAFPLPHIKPIDSAAFIGKDRSEERRVGKEWVIRRV